MRPDRWVAVTTDPASSPPSRLATSANAVRNVDTAEKAAHAAQLLLHEARNLREDIVVAKNNYAIAENAANTALVNAWTRYPTLSARVYTIEDPLQLAMLDLQG